MSATNLDKHNRWRSKTVAFRMSPEEANTLDEFVKLSGLTKQDYYFKLYQDFLENKGKMNFIKLFKPKTK